LIKANNLMKNIFQAARVQFKRIIKVNYILNLWTIDIYTDDESNKKAINELTRDSKYYQQIVENLK